MIVGRTIERDLLRVFHECLRTNEKDPYGCVAAHFLGIDIKKVDKDMREWAKQRMYEIAPDETTGN